MVILYENRVKIINKILRTTLYADQNLGQDEYWAKEILKGGYVLHFRHAERDKWIDVQMYDALESDLHENGIDNSRYAENDYFSQAVCLNKRGLVQAKAMGEHLSHIGLPISHVVSSVSCRARQTAELAFGGYDAQNRLLVHSGPYNENLADRIKKLVEFYTSLTLEDGKNVIVSSHNGVVRAGMFENLPVADSESLSLEEGGFYVIKLSDGKLRLEHEFHYFKDFAKVFYER